MITKIALLAVALMIAGTGAARADTLRVATLSTDAGAEVFYGLDRGFFHDAGLDVEVQMFANGAAMASAVVSGAIDIGYANIISLAQAHERNVPLVVLYPGPIYDGAHPATLLVVARDSAIHSARDLEGKTIAVNGLGTTAQLAPMAWVDRAGGNGGSIHFVELSSAQTFVAVAEHRVDAAEVTEPNYAANAASVRAIAPGLDGIARTFVSGAYFTSRAWAAAHPDAVAKFVSALQRTAVWANANHDDSATILAKYAKMDPALIAKMQRTPYATSIVPAQMQIQIDVATKYHFLDHAFPITEILH